MLELFIKGPSSLLRYRIGPFGCHMDALAARFSEQGYSRHSAHCLLRGVSHLSHFLLWQGVADVDELRPEHIDTFFKEHLPNCSCDRPNSGAFSAIPSSVKHVLEFLSAQNLLQGFEPVLVPADCISGILMRYDEHLQKIRGLSNQSRGLHRRTIKRFLGARYGQLGHLNLSEMTTGDVLDYTREALATTYSNAWKRNVLTCLRRFLRFLHWERIHNLDLSRAVPSVIHWKLAAVPTHLSVEEVRLLLNAPSNDTPLGRRDKAILLLLALLGLRAGEVASLKLDHVHWREACVTVPRSKVSRQRSLPLPPELADVLARYLQHDQPKTRDRAVFLRRRAPVKPLSSSQVGTIVRKHILQAGIVDAPKRGAHVLRHTLATRLVNQEVSMKEIADILGHTNLETTCIYTKVDTNRLSEVPRPFPTMKES